MLSNTSIEKIPPPFFHIFFQLKKRVEKKDKKKGNEKMGEGIFSIKNASLKKVLKENCKYGGWVNLFIFRVATWLET